MTTTQRTEAARFARWVLRTLGRPSDPRNIDIAEMWAGNRGLSTLDVLEVMQGVWGR